MDDLPIIVVSAANDSAAKEIISELIDNDVSCEYEQAAGVVRVWRLLNKYYRADVRVQQHADTQQHHQVEAHIIYLTQQECEEGVAVCERGARAAGAWWGRGEVERAVVVRGAGGDALEAWAAGARALLVVLGEEAGPPPGPREPFAESCGIKRLREQLHAHAWRNHTRVDAAHSHDVCALLEQWGEEEEEEEEWGEWVEGRSVGAVLAHSAALARLVAEARDSRSAPGRLLGAARLLRALTTPHRDTSQQ